MPVYTIGLPDGREAKIEAPEGSTEADVLAYVEEQWKAGAFGQADTQQPQQPVTEDFSSGLIGLGETALAMGSGIAGSALGGLYGLASAPFVGSEQAAQNVKDVQQSLTYTPSSESAQAILGGISRPFTEIEKGQQALGETALEATDSPLAATAAYMAPDVISSLFGLSAMKNLKTGTQLKKGGLPTRELKDALNKHGIVYENLTPQAKAAIPDVAPKSLLLGKPKTAQTVEKALATDIKKGGSSSGLAKYNEFGGKLFDDPIAGETIRQGWDEGVVQAVKNVTPETRKSMEAMLKTMERVKGDRSVYTRPSDVVGTAAQKRIQFIANKVDKAHKELDVIALKNLNGKVMDSMPVEKAFRDALSDLQIGFKLEGGKPLFDFKASVIQADGSSQRVIEQLADLLATPSRTGKAPDALRFHMLKRQIDALIEWNKNPTQGITSGGKNALKKVRAAVNDSLREADPNYARVNDIMSRGLKAFDNLDSATASRINVQKTLDDPRAMGQELRKLFSNYQTRVDLDNAIRDLDRAVMDLNKTGKEVGKYYGKDADMERYIPPQGFNDSVHDLAMFANALDEQFGAVARTSLQGDMESAVKFANRAATQGTTSAVTQGIGEKAMELAKQMRNIDNYHAYRAMEELLKRGSK